MTMHNTFGCRASVPDEKRMNVVCIGDSITYGSPHGHIHAFPQVADSLSDRWAFMNMGYPGGGPARMLRHWTQHASLHKPCAFILQFPYFDRHHDPRQPYIDGLNDDTWLHGVMSKRNEFSSHELEEMASKMAWDAINDCSRLVHALKETAPVKILFFKYWSGVCNEFDQHKDFYWKEVRDLARKMDCQLIDMGGMLRLEASGMAVKHGDCHPNKNGHRHWADVILDNMDR